MFKKISPMFVFVSILALVTLACGGGYMPLPYVEAGLGNPDSTQAPAEVPAQINTTAAQAPAQPILSDSVTDFYGQACQLYGALIVGPEKDWKVTVFESNGRIWQPCLPEEKDRLAFESSFTGQTTGQFTFHGINATLWQDTDKDGTPDKVLAEKVGSKVVSIEAGGWYKVVHGAHNGGFDLVPLQ